MSLGKRREILVKQIEKEQKKRAGRQEANNGLVGTQKLNTDIVPKKGVANKTLFLTPSCSSFLSSPSQRRTALGTLGGNSLF